jgi:glycosyltransferase involved in cell wall biosynthesis
VDKVLARERFGLAKDARIMVSVGGLVERKGFHRVLEVMPALLGDVPSLHYVLVGGASPAGDMGAELRAQVERLGLRDRVTFTGPLPPGEIKWALSAADVFVLATRYEGWANVFLEAMACGLPVVTTRVGGNAEVVRSPEHGTLVPFGDAEALRAALAEALRRGWDRDAIVAYARRNGWDKRIPLLAQRFRELTTQGAGGQRRA